MIAQYFSVQEIYKRLTRRFSMLSSDSPGSNYRATLRMFPCPLALIHTCHSNSIAKTVRYLAQTKSMPIIIPIVLVYVDMKSNIFTSNYQSTK
jgi:hypothetical protein